MGVEMAAEREQNGQFQTYSRFLLFSQRKKTLRACVPIRIFYFAPMETWVCEPSEHGVTLWYEEAIGRLIDIDHVCLCWHYNCHSTSFH